MADSPGSIGTGRSGADALAQALGLDRASPRTGGSATISAAGGGTVGGRPTQPRGMRMLSPDVPVESLDRMAPRGTYLDILV